MDTFSGSCWTQTSHNHDILVPLSSSEYKSFIKSINTPFNCLFMQLKQQTCGHNNISFLKVHDFYSFDNLCEYIDVQD